MEYIPKNIRQIGGCEDRVKVYMEDYVSTYLGRVRETQEEMGVAGLLVGSWQQEGSSIPCVFISGAMVVSQAGLDGGQVCFSEEAWNEGYQTLGTYFSGQDLCGLFVCEGSCRRFRRQALFAAVRECFPDREALLYLLTEEGEEIVYRILPRGEERLQGYYCYFERNEAMQDYMVDRLPDRRVEWEIHQTSRRQDLTRSRGQEGSLGDPADPAFRLRQKMGRKKEPVPRGGQPRGEQPSGRGIVALCAVMALVIVISGMGLAYRERGGLQVRDLLSRLHIDPNLLAAVSALPEETGEHYVGRDSDREFTTGLPSPGILVEEIPGHVYPTEGESVEERETEPSEPETTQPPEPETTQPPESSQPETTEPETTQPPESSELETEETLPVWTGVIYTVQAGDSLYSISRRFYGTEEMVVVIQQLNDLKNADLIKAGQELLLP